MTTTPSSTQQIVVNPLTGSIQVINAGPVGPRGLQGVKGDTGTIAIGTTTALPNNSPATVTNTGTATAAIFNFGLPKGDTGTITIGTTTAIPNGSPATVTNTGTSTDAILNFGLPKGNTGTISVGTAATLPNGSPATVTNTGTPTEAVFNFGLPKGDPGVVSSTTAPTDTNILWVDTNTSGLEVKGEVRSDQQGNYSYIGVAPAGTLESSNTWKVTRITLSGQITTAVALNVSWVNRLSATYT